MWQWLLGFLVLFVVLLAISAGIYRRRSRRSGDIFTRKKDIEFVRAKPGSTLKFHPDDGKPGGPRGKVWSEKKRAEYRRKCQRTKMRIIAGG